MGAVSTTKTSTTRITTAPKAVRTIATTATALETAATTRTTMMARLSLTATTSAWVTVVLIIVIVVAMITSEATTSVTAFQMMTATTRSKMLMNASTSSFQLDQKKNCKNSSSSSDPRNTLELMSRRGLFSKIGTASTTAAAIATMEWGSMIPSASAVGPTKINLLNPTYTATPCPKDKPIPGEKAMKGMKGLCVTVTVDLEEAPPQVLEKAGVYGFVTDRLTGESVLANNPDLSTDAGQFAMIPEVKTTDNKIQFEFIAAVPREQDTSQYEEGIAPLDFGSLRVISYPGGQQYGAINPCEMNEFSDECDAWQEENGPYQKGEFMVKSNPRTKGR